MMIPFFVFFISCAGAAIIPEELPSLLSVAYSNIPPIKKGTDSRIGFGFSLGNHADFQVLFELGPQANTNPIGTPYQTNSKRQAVHTVRKESQAKQKLTSSDGGKYLSSWSQNFKQKKGTKPFQPLPIPGDDANKETNPSGTVDLQKIITTMGTKDGIISQPRPDVPHTVLTQLKELYGDKATKDETLEPVKLAALANNDRPRFVPKRNSNKPTVKPNVPSFQRLSQFKIQEDRMSQLKKKKITEELSDVSLDDE